jgi:hypothetical protein
MLRIANYFGCGLLLLALVPLTGCADKGPHLEAVEGRVTLGGGDWPVGGTLTFAPLEAEKGLPQLPGWAAFEADGRFVAQCASGPGLVPGKYVVNVVCAGEGEGHDGKPVRSRVSPAYQAKPHQVIVERNRTGELTLDIPKG